MRALSVRAPWAGLIATGTKTLEVRSRRTHYRGELLICESGGGGAVVFADVLVDEVAVPVLLLPLLLFPYGGQVVLESLGVSVGRNEFHST